MTGEIVIGIFIGIVSSVFCWMLISFYRDMKKIDADDMDYKISRKIRFALDEYDKIHCERKHK